MTWLRQLLEVEGEQDPTEFLESLKVDLFEDEVFVFTPKGEVKNLSAGSTPLDFAYAVHTDVGHRCVGAKVNGKIVPLHYQLKSGDIVEILTAKQERGPSRDWLALVRTSRARNKIRAFLKRERRDDAERRGREQLQDAIRKRGLPPQRIAASPLLADVTREMGFRKADDFYIAVGQGKISPKTVANKVFQRLKQGEAVAGDETEARLAGVLEGRDERQRRTQEASDYGIKVKGVDDVMIRLAKCCRPGARRPDRRLRVARARDHDPPRRLQEHDRAEALSRAVHRGGVGGGQRDLLPRRAPGRCLGSHPPARGPLADLRGDGREHHRGLLQHQAPDGQEPVRGRGRRRRAAPDVRRASAKRRLGLRRVSRDAHVLTDEASANPNVAATRRFIEAYNEGDLDGLVALADPNIEWEVAPEHPAATTHRGIDAVREYHEDWRNTLHGLRIDLHSIAASGDSVVTVCGLRGEGAESGADVEVEIALPDHVPRRKAVRVEEFLDPEEAMRALESDSDA